MRAPEPPPPPPDFGLAAEVLAVLPSDPFAQLDVARKITSIALATRISNLESEAARLRQRAAEKDDVIAELRAQVETLDASLADLSRRLQRADQEKPSTSSVFGSNEPPPPPPDFGLGMEVLAVLPPDPFAQLDVARKITSITLSTRISNVESEAACLRQCAAEKDDVIAELRTRVETLDASLTDLSRRLQRADQEKPSTSSIFGSNEPPLPPPDFRLAVEVLAVLPSDPFAQLDVARKITSVTLATRISNLESEAARLRQRAAEKNDIIAELRAQVETLDASLADLSRRLQRADQEKPSTSSVFVSNFGSSTSSSPSTGFTFGSSVPSGTSSPIFGSSSGPASSFTSLASSTSSFSSSHSPSIFGLPSPATGFNSGSQGNDQMKEDSMADDTVQATASAVPVFGQPVNSPAMSNFMFSSSGQPAFQIGGHQNSSIPQNQSPFRAGGNLELSPGGSFSLGGGGADKSSRKILKVKRDKHRKK